MNVLFVQPKLSGGFAQLALALVGSGHTVVALSTATSPAALDPRIRIVRYVARRSPAQDVHPWAAEAELRAIAAEAAAHAMISLHRSGFTPQVIVAATAHGEALLAKDVFPAARLIVTIDRVETRAGAEFDKELLRSSPANDGGWRFRSALDLVLLEAMDWGIAPTQWHRAAIAGAHQSKITVIPEGIDTANIRPNASVSIRVGRTKMIVRAGDEVLSFVSRRLEPERGFHMFMRALPEILRQRPHAVVLIVGDRGIARSSHAQASAFDRVIEEVRAELDPSRVFFLGAVAHEVVTTVLQVTKVHVALSSPIAPPRSMLEAMSTGALVVGSTTPPIQEVIAHGRNGLLVGFFDLDELANTIAYALSGPVALQPLRHQARADVVQRYDLTSIAIPRRAALVTRVGILR